MPNSNQDIPSFLQDLISRSKKIQDKNSESENDKKGVVYNLDLATELKQEEVRSKKQNTDERKKYAHLTFNFLCWFTFGLFFFIFLTGVNSSPLARGFYLSDSVLITLITTSLSTVVGIFIFVMRYLFNNNS